MVDDLVAGVRDVTSREKLVRVPSRSALPGLQSRIPIDCDSFTCRRFIALSFDYTLRKVLNNFIVGIALPRNYSRNANITFIPEFNRDIRARNAVNLNSCGRSSGNGGYSGKPPPRKELICELYEGLTNGLGQMQIATQWNFCQLKVGRNGERANDYEKKCDEIDQSEAILEYLSGKNSRILSREMIPGSSWLVLARERAAKLLRRNQSKGFTADIDSFFYSFYFYFTLGIWRLILTIF